ncbi:MAG: RNA 2',3'-cyclic phosphodiesterase [Planctomycetota bacterium]
MAKKIRTFIGVKASQRVSSNVSRVATRLESTGVEYNWVLPENLHVTLNYVGDVIDVEVPELCKLVKNVVQKFEPFELSLRGVSAFPEVEQPRIIWIGVDEGREAMHEIYGDLADELHQWGVNRERKPYVPHMTIGRVRRGGRWNDSLMEQMHRLRNHDGGFCQVSEVIVFASYLEKVGPSYTPMATIRL